MKLDQTLSSLDVSEEAARAALEKAPELKPLLMRFARKALKGQPVPRSFTGDAYSYETQQQLERLLHTVTGRTADGKVYGTILEFMREMPGVLLVCVLAAMSRFSDWRVLRIGTVLSILAAGLLLLPVPWAGAVALITFWSLGEHTVMPVRQSLALMLAKDGKGGESLGFMTSMINAGTVVGSLVVAGVFFGGRHCGADVSPRTLYDAVFAPQVVAVPPTFAVSVFAWMTRSCPPPTRVK